MAAPKINFRSGSTWLYFLWALAALFPVFVSNGYILDMLVYVLLWAGVGAAWNISAGYGGLLSLGHATYFGIGAYISTLLYVSYQVSPWIGMLAGASAATLVALLIGVLTLRLAGTFYTLATIAFCSIAGLLAVALKKLSSGSLGILISPKPGFLNMTWHGKTIYVYLMFVFAFGMFLLCAKIEKTKFGISLLAVRDSEDAARALGVNTAAVKIKSTLISAFFTAIGGTLYAQYNLFIEPQTVFSIGLSVQFALVVIVGGIGLAFGPLLGSIVFVLLTAGLRGWLTQLNGLSGLLYGALLIIIVMFVPDGLIPKMLLLFPGSREKKTTALPGK